MKFLLLAAVFFYPACKTRSDLRREQEFERLKDEVKEVRSGKADAELVGEEFKLEISRVSNQVEENYHKLKLQNDELKAELQALELRVRASEQKLVQAEEAKNKVEEKPKVTLELGKKLYDEGNFDGANDIFRAIIKARPSSEEARRAHFLMAEGFFAGKDYASAALEYSEFKKRYPKDSHVPNAIYRQAASFKNMGKSKEAKLFYQELIERFPKNPLVAKAKQDMKKLR